MHPGERERPSPARHAGLILIGLPLVGLTSACLQLNPHHSDSSTDSDASTSSGTSSSTGASTTGATTSATGSAGETTTASETTTATTGPAPGFCGDGARDDGEACDDGNDAPDDGCVLCTIPRTCAEILALAPGSPSGPYLIDPGETGAPWPATCDMDKDGGGWTGFVVEDTCTGRLTSVFTTLDKAQFEVIDDQCRPYHHYVNAGGNDGGRLAYTWDIVFPPTFSAFFLRDYSVLGTGGPELNFTQTLWAPAFKFPDGALSLGDGHAPGPITNWSAAGGQLGPLNDGQPYLYPVQETPFHLDQDSDLLRIGWGEIGVTAEGLYPWWAGQIFVR